MSDLDIIIETLLTFDGISRKFVLPRIISKLRDVSYNGDTPHSLGEDSAAILTGSNEFVLLTTDAIVEELCVNHPEAAGFNVVLANIMDIYAAGGTPTSFAVALSYSDEETGRLLLEGLINGSHTFKVPIVRGHTNSKSTSTYVVGSATGTVKENQILTAGGAEEGDTLVLLFDRVGGRGEHYTLGWDSVTDRESSEVIKRLTVMNELAQEGLVNASKDVSVAGMIGTAGMLVEYSGVGGIIDLDIIRKSAPSGLDLLDWLRMYISLGFLIAIPVRNVPKVSRIAQDHEMEAIRIGEVDSGASLRLRMGDEEKVIFDFSKGPILTPRSSYR
ncbi:hypothetical protein EU537_07965 [Candidatus Thorarchaeota archaeon]|nr:MAG: hypothetical protein EU537_07965 [Candidatus Thorarchaeota archaeon]